MSDALARPVLSALTTRQQTLALVEGAARRFAPAYGVFAAVDGGDFAGLAALVRETNDVALLEADPPPPIEGLSVVSIAAGVQMVAADLADRRPQAEFIDLTDADGPEMLALATLTAPGPFFERTHQLGDFIGVKSDGRLIAMAGERMKPTGFTEVSGVCTHPNHRGKGLAALLTLEVAHRIAERGETPFLHVYATNTGAIALYEKLGFVKTRELAMTRLTAA